MDFCRGRSGLALAMAFVALASGAQDAGDGQRTGEARGGDRATKIQTWFMSGRSQQGDSAAEGLRRAYQQKLAMRQAAGGRAAAAGREGRPPATSSFLHLQWSSMGPRPIDSDPTLFQSYGLVSGRVTSLVVDQKDATGNTVYIGSANGGVWKSSNAATADANAVTWQALTDDQPSLAIGALALQPGASGNVGVILAGTGEANNTSDSYYGMGFLRSTDAGETWTSVISADGGTRPLRGLSFSRIAFHTGNPELVVAGASSSNGGSTGAELQGDPGRGMYFSLDAGVTWSYAAMNDSGVATQAAAVTDVVFNPGHGKFYASVRAHGYYESVNGQTWTRMAQQPGAGLTAVNCPAATNAGTCPLVRGQLAVRAGTGELFTVWVDALNALSIYKLSSSGAAWQQLGQAGIDNCGDPGPDAGCGAQNGSFNLTLHAVPNGLNTDLYLGAANIFKCTVTVQDPLCAGSAAWKNLTHAYGCSPLGAPAHVHPGQHAIDHSEALPGVLYFANDGGVYRSLNGYGLNADSCAATNPFASLNANLGPLSQFVSLAQPGSDAGMLLGGVAGNGSPLFQASNAGASGMLWRAINLGDGGYSAISPGDANLLYTSFPAGESAVIQRCGSGVSCRQDTWSTVADPGTFGNDAAAFFLPFQLDPKNADTLLAGTCRVWRGPASGGAFTALSPVFSGGGATCSGGTASGETKIRALAAGGATAVSGNAKVIYAGMAGRAGGAAGRIFVTTDADAGPSAWSDRTGGINSVNPSEYDVSAIVISPFDATGNTAYATIMGFGVAHVFKTVNAGVTWVNKSGNLPDVPVNSITIDPGNSAVLYAGTDTGVFLSADDGVTWAELGSGLPNVPVMKLLTFVSGDTRKLRAATYGRGVWQIELPVLAVRVSPASLTLPATVVGRLSSPQAVVLSNDSAAAITLTEISATGAFTVEHDCPSTLPVGASCNIVATFQPVSGGAQNGSLQVNYSSGGKTVALAATGIDFKLSLARPRRPLRGGGGAGNVMELDGLTATFDVVLAASGTEAGDEVHFTCASPTPWVRCRVSPERVRLGATPVVARVVLERQSSALRARRLSAVSGSQTGTYSLTISAHSGTVVRLVEVLVAIR